MVWTPKSSSPEYFSLADATLALITGDATWGWIVDWLTLVPNTGYSTAEFCAAGPPTALPADSPLFNQTPDASLNGQSGHIVSLAFWATNAARDRVFAAYCEGPPPAPTSGWCPSEFVSVPGTQSLGADGAYPVWVAPAGNTSVHVRLASRVGSGLDARVDDGYSYPPWVGRGTLGGYNDASGAPSSWSTWSLAGGEALRFLRYAGGDHTYEIQPNACRASEHEPTDQPQPAGALSPLRTVDPSLDGIAHEVELLEFKLDNLMSLVQSIAGATLDLGGDVLEDEAVEADTPEELGDAVGVVVKVSGVPSSKSMDFGVPVNIVRLAHLNFGTADAWYPSIWITHTPLIVRPLPPGATRFSITDLPPGATATVAKIARNK